MDTDPAVPATRIPSVGELRRVTEEWVDAALTALKTLVTAKREHLLAELLSAHSTRATAYRRLMDRTSRATQWAVAFASGEGHRPEVIDKLTVADAEALWRGMTVEIADFKTSAAYGSLGLCITAPPNLHGLSTHEARTRLADLAEGKSNLDGASLDAVTAAVAAGTASTTQLLLYLYLSEVRPLQLQHLRDRRLPWTHLPIARQPAIIITNHKGTHQRASKTNTNAAKRPRVGRQAEEKQREGEPEDAQEGPDQHDNVFGLRLRTTCRYLVSEYLAKLEPPARMVPSDLRHLMTASVQLGVAAACVTGQQAEVAAVARGHSARLASTTYCVRVCLLSTQSITFAIRRCAPWRHGSALRLHEPSPHVPSVLT
jgi:hypothetical protein